MNENPYSFFFLEKEQEEKQAHQDLSQTKADAEKPVQEATGNSIRLLSFADSPYAVPCLCVLCGVSFVLFMRFLPSVAAAVGYPLGWLLTVLYQRRENGSSFLRSFLPGAVTLLLALPLSFLWSFLSQTDLYSLYDYLTHSHTWANCLFQCGLAIGLAAFGVYSTMPSKKEKTPKDDFHEEQA